ncbi:MAG: thioesterase [Chromatiales bacterium]|nr:thioesterase [Chromatiales bacterium]
MSYPLLQVRCEVDIQQSPDEVVVFELARELRQRGHDGPAFLFASGASAPQVPRDDEPLHGLSDDELVRQLSERYGGIPPQVLENEELLALVLPALRADLTLIETYVCREVEPLSCPLLAYAGVDDQRVTPEKLERWQEMTTGEFSSRLFPGDHFYLNGGRDDLIAAVLQAFVRIHGNPAC